ncbi:hypothetical protein ACH5RR_029846 [Cinchona calisaya]|uniref:Uncharacterized protein n=1 Tax=Cinchona calisaya TaxID=153742 RepID=A0ABD2YWP7_9GENT
MSAKEGKTPLVTLSPQVLNAILGDTSCHNICDKEESSESTSGRGRPWNRPKKRNKGNSARDLDMAIIDSEALIQDDTLEEMEVSVTEPSKFDFSNAVHSSSNTNLTKNLDDGGNDVANNQAMTQIENTIMTWGLHPFKLLY